MGDTILIVEDEEDLRLVLEVNLRREGFTTLMAATGQDGIDQFKKGAPDLVILDLMLPDMSGHEVCRNIRAFDEDASIIMLTAKGEEADRVKGLEGGADDYMVKPFSIRELVLRMRAVLRRSGGNEKTPVIEFGCLRLDEDAHRVWVNDKEVQLTALEFRLLGTFLERKGRAQSRDQLLSDVWGIQADVTTRTVDTHVKRLREKIGDAGKYIETVRGVGYRFASSPDKA